MTSRSVEVGKDDARTPWIGAAAVCVLLAIELAWLGRVPFISEDWTQMAEMRSVPTFFGALDPRIEPLRPFQHAFFWWIAHCGADPTGESLPFVARALGFALHAGSCACVWWLAREAGAKRAGALAACILFAAFPNVKTLAWSAAIGTPGRTYFELAALLFLARHARAPNARDAILGLAAFVLALGFHESAMLLPAILVLWIVFVQGQTLRDGASKLWRASRDPWLVAFAVMTCAYAVQLVLRPQRHHGLKSFASLPANVVKAETALVPEWIRTVVIDGFRAGPSAPAAFAAAAVVFVSIALLAFVLFRRSRIARFVLAACAIDLGLAVIGAGFVQRYAYWPSALVAVGLGLWVARDLRVFRVLIVSLLAAWWLADTAVDVRDVRRIRPEVDRLVHSASEIRAHVGPQVPIVVVDAPDMAGTEHDVPLFNWGLDYLLEAHGVSGPLQLWRTRPFATGSNVELVDSARIDAARAAGVPLIDAAHLP
jgi:hypothetical protein